MITAGFALVALLTGVTCERLTGFSSQRAYLDHLKSIASLPDGFFVGSTRITFKPYEVDKILPMNVTLIVTDKPTDVFASLLTSNTFPGGPIYIDRERLQSSTELRAIVVNNKISNVCPGGVSDFGASDSDRICQAVADSLEFPSKALVFPSSTGIIGWKLPVNDIANAIPLAVKTLQNRSIYPAALSITTTDRYPKIRSYVSRDKRWSIAGIAKGAGMIEPNMATMLSYILTDLAVSKDFLQKSLATAVDKSFNAITVDGDQSTSDTVLALSSKKAHLTPGDEAEFDIALSELCTDLAEDIVRNGEGTNHVMKLNVIGAPNQKIARDLGRFILNSNLFKCAIAGCDPNVGRIVAAIGSYLGKNGLNDLASKDLAIYLGGVEIFSKGQFLLDPVTEKTLSDYLLDSQLYDKSIPEHERTFPIHFRTVDIDMVFRTSGFTDKFTFFGSDLTAEYVEINADYRS